MPKLSQKSRFILKGKTHLITKFHKTDSELQIRGGIEDNSKIIFLISQRKRTL